MTATSHERFIGRGLRLGIWISMILLSVGLALSAYEGGVDASGLSLKDLPGVVFGTGKGISPGLGFLYSGLMVLVLTPLLRVAITLVIFFRQRDWRFFGIALVIFTILIIELTVALT